jgi:inosine/xanthosine triphosphatase
MSVRFAVGTKNKAKLESVRLALERCIAPLLEERAALSIPLRAAASTPAPAEGVVTQYYPFAAGGDGASSPATTALPFIITAVGTESGVMAQPFGMDETRQGARNRAHAALDADPSADYGVGLEGGVECDAGLDGRHFECGWICIVERERPATVEDQPSAATKNLHLGRREGWGSSARFELSAAIVDKLRADPVNLELATVMTALSGVENIGSKQGAMGIMSGGALGRAEAYAHGVMFALAPFVSPAKYW